MTKTRYRAAIIGCGRIAGTIEDESCGRPGLQIFPYSHAGAYRAATDVSLVAAVDPDETARTTFGTRWAVSSLFATTAEMLAEVRPDIVSICAPTRFHAQLMAEVADAGTRAVILEKPICSSLAEAESLCEMVRSCGLIVAVNHTRSYDPFYESARSLLEDGFIGRPHTVFASWGEGWSFGGSHLFDLLRRLLASRVDHVYCEGDDSDDPDPGGHAVITYGNGVRAYVSAPRESSTPLGIEVIGDSGRIRLGAMAMQLFRNDTSLGYSVPTEWPLFARMEMRSPMTRMVEEVVGCLDGRNSLTSDIEDGKEALEIAVALNVSSRLGRPVRLPLDPSHATLQLDAS